MDSKRKRSSLARTIAKVLHIRALTEKSSDNDAQKKNIKSQKTKKKKKKDEEDDGLKRAVEEAFMAKLFASISSIKAAYAELQMAQSPYDAGAIQSADRTVVSELTNLSELKQSYANQLDDKSPANVLLLTEVQEQSSLLKTYELTAKKLDSQLKLKDSEITFLKEKLADANDDLKSLGKFVIPNDLTPSGLRPSHFIALLNQTVKSVRSFARLIAGEMESSNWDLNSAANAIQPGIHFWETSHRIFAFESFVCREMFDGFNRPFFSEKTDKKRRGQSTFDRFVEMKPLRSSDYLAWKPKSKFASFCRAKYLRLVRPAMEASLFGGLGQRDSIRGGEFPTMGFFSAFAEVAKCVWLLHCLASSFDPEVSIFEVAKGARYSEVYMESLCDEAFGGRRDDPRVAFSVFPGFKIGRTVIQCQVYLC